MHLFVRIFLLVLLAVSVAFLGGLVVSDWVWPQPEPPNQSQANRERESDDPQQNNEDSKRGPRPPEPRQLREPINTIRQALQEGHWETAQSQVDQINQKQGYRAQLFDLGQWPMEASAVAEFDRWVVSELLEDDEDFIARGMPNLHYAWKIKAPDDREFVMIIEVGEEIMRQQWREAHDKREAAREQRRQDAQWREFQKQIIEAVLFLVAVGLVCFLITRYISSPILKLRTVSKRIAEGDLDQRSAPLIGKRKDEIGELSRDFDVMADRLSSLVLTQRRLLRDVSHELRSPLARQNLAVEMLRQKAGEDLTPLLDRIDREGLRLTALIDELLVIARLAQQESALTHEPVELARVVDDVAADARFEGQARDVAVQVQAEPVSVGGDAMMLGRAIENVVRNAVRYTEPGTPVEITLSARDGQAVLDVRDHGPGVPEADREAIFKPFHRVGAGRDRESGGVGLGLAIAQSIIQAHGGAVRAANPDGGGLVVTITLPLQANGDGSGQAMAC